MSKLKNLRLKVCGEPDEMERPGKRLMVRIAEGKCDIYETKGDVDHSPSNRTDNDPEIMFVDLS